MNSILKGSDGHITYIRGQEYIQNVSGGGHNDLSLDSVKVQFSYLPGVKVTNDKKGEKELERDKKSISKKIKYLSSYLFNYTNVSTFSLTSRGKMTFSNEYDGHSDAEKIAENKVMFTVKAKAFVKIELTDVKQKLKNSPHDDILLNKKLILEDALKELNKQGTLYQVKKNMIQIGRNIKGLFSGNTFSRLFKKPETMTSMRESKNMTSVGTLIPKTPRLTTSTSDDNVNRSANRVFAYTNDEDELYHIADGSPDSDRSSVNSSSSTDSSEEIFYECVNNPTTVAEPVYVVNGEIIDGKSAKSVKERSKNWITLNRVIQ